MSGYKICDCIVKQYIITKSLFEAEIINTICVLPTPLEPPMSEGQRKIMTKVMGVCPHTWK